MRRWCFKRARDCVNLWSIWEKIVFATARIFGKQWFANLWRRDDGIAKDSGWLLPDTLHHLSSCMLFQVLKYFMNHRILFVRCCNDRTDTIKFMRMAKSSAPPGEHGVYLLPRGNYMIFLPSPLSLSALLISALHLIFKFFGQYNQNVRFRDHRPYF